MLLDMLSCVGRRLQCVSDDGHCSAESRSLEHPTRRHHWNCLAKKKEDTFRRSYKILQQRIDGAFGTVCPGIRRFDRKPIAVKFLPKTQIRAWDTMDELRVPLEYSLLRRASHWVPGVIDVVDAFDLGSSFAIVMERLEPGKDLLDLVAQEGPLHEALAHCYFTQIVNAVIGCFRAGILHRDLKAENIMVNAETGTVKLVDFGCAAYKRTTYTEMIGSECYFSPEMILQGRYSGEKAAVWALGIILHWMVYGRLPFENKIQIIAASYPVAVTCQLSVTDCFHDLISHLLHPNSQNRLTLQGITRHCWYHKH